MRIVMSVILVLGLVGCATLPEKFQPSLRENYGIIKAGNGIFIESIDDKHLSLGIYGYKGDIRVYPGEHVIGMHYDSPGIFAHYSGSKSLMTVNVKEGTRYYIGADITRKFGIPQTWKPLIIKEEEIEDYWKSRRDEY